MRGITWVVIEEVASGEWGVGGKALTTEDVKARGRGSGRVVSWTGSSPPISRANPERDQDAGRPNITHIRPTEDAVSRRDAAGKLRRTSETGH